MSVKQKCNIFEKMYDILVIYVDFCRNFHDFGRFFCYQDPFPHHNRFIKRIRLAEIKRILNTD